MNITIAAATRFEIREDALQNTKHQLYFLYTGVGILASAVSLMQHQFQSKPDLIIQVGIAGCFDKNVLLGSVVAVESETLGDTGVWEEGEWKDLFDMKLLQPDAVPYLKKRLSNEQIDDWNVLQLPKMAGVTINEITTGERREDVLTTKYGAVVESMEGASLHYVCRLFGIPFIQVRSISNYVGERDKSAWKMREAIESVNEAVRGMIDLIPGPSPQV